MNDNDNIPVTVKQTPDGLVMSLAPGQPTDSEPHTVAHPASRRHDLPDATEIAPGVTLATRDGLQMGNAIVIKEVQPRSEQITQMLKAKEQKLWLVETDFGNTARLTDGEIHELFVLSRQDDYDRWWGERMDAIQNTVNESAG
jgi:hypothetical protein